MTLNQVFDFTYLAKKWKFSYLPYYQRWSLSNWNKNWLYPIYLRCDPNSGFDLLTFDQDLNFTLFYKINGIIFLHCYKMWRFYNGSCMFIEAFPLWWGHFFKVLITLKWHFDPSQILCHVIYCHARIHLALAVAYSFQK